MYGRVGGKAAKRSEFILPFRGKAMKVIYPP